MLTNDLTDSEISIREVVGSKRVVITTRKKSNQQYHGLISKFGPWFFNNWAKSAFFRLQKLINTKMTLSTVSHLVFLQWLEIEGTAITGGAGETEAETKQFVGNRNVLVKPQSPGNPNLLIFT